MMHFEKSNETNNSLLNSLDIHIRKGVRSFHTGNKESVVQSAAKLVAVKVGGVKEKSAASAIAAKVSASASANV